MRFWDYFYVLTITFIVLHLNSVLSDNNEDIIIVDSGVDNLVPNSIGLILHATVNNTSASKDFNVEFIPEECCLNIDSKDVCDVMFIEGECVENVPKSTTKVLKLVMPLINPFERRGYCKFYLDSRPVARQRKVMRDKIKINFDTRVKSMKLPQEFADNVSICNEIDEDPMNGCKPVDCLTYYNGRRPFFDNRRKRCIAAPICISDNNSEPPKVIYDKRKNKCVEGALISKDDINLIKKLTQSTRNRTPKDILILKNYASPQKNLPTNEIKDNAFIRNRLITNRKESLNSSKIGCLQKKGSIFVRKYVLNNKWTFSVLTGVIMIQCFLICTMFYCFTGKCGKCKNKKVVRKFFNYRQDASVTTPLICTSNIDTETTEFQNHSETSNIDKMIRCYKSCQRERKHSKISMSDDILSKCLTRRDWKSKQKRTVAKTGSHRSEDESIIEPLNEELREQTASILYQANMNEPSRKPSNVKVNFENEETNTKTQNKYKKSAEINKECKKNRINDDYDNLRYDLSERELKCHSYNNESKLEYFKQNNDTNRISFFESDKNKLDLINVPTEKSVQVVVSSDSLDDLIKEGECKMLCGNEDFYLNSISSNYSEVTKGSSFMSEISSKTSKKNVLRNIVSIFHKKSRPSSDPGVKKRDSNINLELIHVSKASMQSSHNDSDYYMKTLKQIKDSKTYF